MTFTATLTSSLACFTVFPSTHSTEGNENSTVLHCPLSFCSCLSRLSRWNAQIVFFRGWGGEWLPVLSLALVFEETIDESVESFARTARYCTLGEISPRHTHLQRAHLLISPSSRRLIGPIVSRYRRLKCLSIKQANRFFFPAHLRTHTPARTLAHKHTHLHYASFFRLIRGLPRDVDAGRGPSSLSPLSPPDVSHLFARGTEGLTESGAEVNGAGGDDVEIAKM